MKLNIFVVGLLLLSGCSIFGGKSEPTNTSGPVRMPQSVEWSFEGIPFVKSSIRGFTTKSELLTGDKSAENKLTIKHQNGEYFWESRDNKKLVGKEGPKYLVLSDAVSGDEVKIDKDTGEFFGIYHNAMETIYLYGFQK